MSIDINSRNLNNYAKRFQKTINKELNLSESLSLSQASELLSKALGFNTTHDLKQILNTPEERNENFQKYEKHRLALEKTILDYYNYNPDSLISQIFWSSIRFSKYRKAKEDSPTLCLWFSLGKNDNDEISEPLESAGKEGSVSKEDARFIEKLRKQYLLNDDFIHEFNCHMHSFYNLHYNQSFDYFKKTKNYFVKGFGMGTIKYFLFKKNDFKEEDFSLMQVDKVPYILIENIDSLSYVNSVEEAIEKIKKDKDLIYVGGFIFSKNTKAIGYYTCLTINNKLLLKTMGPKAIPFLINSLDFFDYATGYFDKEWDYKSVAHSSSYENYLYNAGYLAATLAHEKTV